MEIRVVREEFYDQDLGRYGGYGIVARSPSGWTAYLPDLSTRESWVRTLAEKLQRLEVSPVHLMDVVLDSLG